MSMITTSEALSRFIENKSFEVEVGAVRPATLTKAEEFVAMLGENLPNTEVEALDPQDFRRLIQTASKRWGPLRLKQLRAFVLGWLRWCLEDEGLIERMPRTGSLKTPKVVAKPKETYTPEEIRTLFNDLDSYGRSLLGLGLFAGLNCSDIEHLTPAALDGQWFVQPRHTTTRLATAALVMSFGVAGIALAEGESRPGVSNAHGLRPDRPRAAEHPGLRPAAESDRGIVGNRCGTDSDAWSVDGPELGTGAKSYRLWSDQQAKPRGNDLGDHELEWIAAMEDPFGFGVDDLETARADEPEFTTGVESDRSNDWSADDLDADVAQGGPGFNCDPMDLDRNGSVDLEDFALVIEAFGTDLADLDRDGITDGRDLGLMLARLTAPVVND